MQSTHALGAERPKNFEMIPRTIEEAVSCLIRQTDDKTKEYIRNLRVNDLSELHFSLGMGIRNSFGLWGENKELLRACSEALNIPGYMGIHEDQASSVIIEAFWRELNK